jgi:hypothetical protein
MYSRTRLKIQELRLEIFVYVLRNSVNLTGQLIRNGFKMKTSVSQCHVSSFRVVIWGIKFRYSSLPVRGNYEKRLLVEISGAVMSFKEPGETVG